MSRNIYLFSHGMKKLILLLCCISCFGLSAFSQGGTWTWMKGSNLVNSPGNYGTQGIPGSANNPPARYQAAYWTDFNGDFWLFGGSTFIGFNTEFMNDLWRYSVATNQWTWMGGPQLVTDQNGNYGPLGTASTTSYPSARGNGAITWTDNNGDLWLYGGNGIDANGVQGVMSDLWKYDIITNEWTWVKGGNTANAPAVYGLQGIANVNNTPGSRLGSKSAWVDAANDLWLFGGNNSAASVSFYNDMWRYNIATNSWTWMKGSNMPNATATYGTLGIEDPANNPSGRWSATRWKGVDGKFYVFGGQSTFSSANANNHNDVWQYNPATNNWAWISGDNVSNTAGTYNMQCDPQSNTFPSARYENHTAQTVSCSETFWSFGGRDNSGNGLNDLWLFNFTLNEWTWVSGSQGPNQAGNYGIQGVASSVNMMPSRYGICMWVDNDNNLWTFGGQNNGFYQNDLWRFEPDTTCFSAPLVASYTLFPPTDTIVCAGDTGKMFIPITAKASWQPNAGVYPNSDTSILSFSPLNNTTYTVTGADTGKCPGADTVVFSMTVITGNSALITPPADTVICLGENTSMTLDPLLNISYSPSNGATPNADTSTITFSPTTTTTYTLIASYPVCSLPDTSLITIVVDPLDNVILTPPNPIDLCLGDTTQMFIDPSYDVTFAPGIAAFPNIDTSVITFVPPFSQNYRVIAQTNGTCPNIDSIDFVISTTTITTIFLPEIGDQIICELDTFKYDLPVTAEGVFLNDWSGVYPNADTSTLSFSPAVSSSYSLVADAGNCSISDTISFNINLLQRVQADFVVSPIESILKFANFTMTNTSLFADSFLWYEGNIAFSSQKNTQRKAKTAGEVCFKMVANNIANCPDSITKCVTVTPNPSFIVIPNAFTPNGDGLNDTYRILFSEVELKEYALYNRWGNEVFRDNSGVWGWDGKYKGVPLPSATYFYYIRYIENGEEKIKKGDLTLIR